MWASTFRLRCSLRTSRARPTSRPLRAPPHQGHSMGGCLPGWEFRGSMEVCAEGNWCVDTAKVREHGCDVSVLSLACGSCSAVRAALCGPWWREHCRVDGHNVREGSSSVGRHGIGCGALQSTASQWKTDMKRTPCILGVPPCKLSFCAWRGEAAQCG